MIKPQADALRVARCVPCEGGVEPLTAEQNSEYLSAIPEWSLSDDGLWIRRKVNRKHFAAALALLNEIAELAEREQHHPDLHLTGYRHLLIELTTHAIGGLSENDFVLAAKIDALVDAQ